MNYFRAVSSTNEKQVDCTGAISDNELGIDEQVEKPDEIVMHIFTNGKVTSMALILSMV